VNPNEVKDIVHKADPKLHGNSKGFRVACMLIAGLETQNVYDLSKLFRYPLDFVKSTAYNLQDNKIWVPGKKGGKTRCEWFHEEYGFTAFWLDVNIGLGYIIKIEA